VNIAKQRWAWIGGIAAAALAAVGITLTVKGSGAKATPGPVAPSTGSPTLPNVSLAAGNMGTLSLPSFSAASNPANTVIGESVLLQGPMLGGTQGAITAVVSSNPSVMPSWQNQSSLTALTLPVLAAGTTTLNYSYVDSTNTTRTGQLTVTVAP
jgi:hypothetical protein